VQVNQRMLEWADVVFIMDEDQRADLARMFPGLAAASRAVMLQIKDDYHFLDPELVKLLQERVTPHLDRLRAQPPEAEGRSQ
jgi:predicted protein tyrosine phosphatase